MKQKIEIEVDIPEGYEYVGTTIPSGVFYYENAMDITYRHKLKKKEPKRWRAEENGIYWTLNALFQVCRSRDVRSCLDNENYKCSNYFRYEMEAKRFAAHLKQSLSDYHKEILSDE